MLSSVSPSSDPYGGDFDVYKTNFELLPSQIPFKHPGAPTKPEKRTIDVPPIRESVNTDRKKTNAQIVYTRVTPSDSHLCAGKSEFCVFVSRSKLMCTGNGHDRRSRVASLDLVNQMLREETNDAVLPAAVNPRDDWRATKLLREWTPDGILLGLDNEINASQVLNVCVAGSCPARNVFDKESVFVADVCYLMLVADLVVDSNGAQVYRFQYVPCTTRALSEPAVFRDAACLTRRPSSLTREQRRTAVGGWKIGRVLDTAAVVKTDQHSITLDVRIEWVGWRALKLEYPDSEIADGLPLLPTYLNSSCILFHWPTSIGDHPASPLPAPTTAKKNADEMRLNKDAIEDERARGCVQPPRLPPCRKRPREENDDGIIDPPTPPRSPRDDENKIAEEDAAILIAEIADLPNVVAFLESTDPARPSDFPVGQQTGFDDLKKRIAAFEIAHANVIYYLEVKPPDSGDTALCYAIYLAYLLQRWTSLNTQTPDEEAVQDGLLSKPE
jgi:hypothetical protein